MKVLSTTNITKEQIKKWLEGITVTSKLAGGKKVPAHPLAIALFPTIYDKALEAEINPAVAVAQAMVETKYFIFDGVLRPNFCNVCGLKGNKGGGDLDPNAHTRFEYWEDGIQAFIDHLALYAGAPKYPMYSPNCISHPNENMKSNGTTLDPRHFTYLKGTCTDVEALGGKWCPDTNYGKRIVQMTEEMASTIVEDSTNNVSCKEHEAMIQKYKDDIASLMHSFNDAKSRCEQLEIERDGFANSYQQVVEANQGMSNHIDTITAAKVDIENKYRVLHDTGKTFCLSLSDMLEIFMNEDK